MTLREAPGGCSSFHRAPQMSLEVALTDPLVVKIHKQRGVVQRAREEMVARKTYHTARLFQLARRELDALRGQVKFTLVQGGKA